MIIILMIMIAIVVMLALHNIYSRLNTAFVMTVFGFCLIITALVFYIMKTLYYNGVFEKLVKREGNRLDTGIHLR